jgi:methylmalonyl-CoA carboxyltransferase 5S subunit
MGCDSLCIKDMAALLKPQPAYDIVKGIKTPAASVRVHVHTHATTGVTLVSLMKAIEAGADCVDTAISSLSLGPGHNPTESLVEMLEGTGYTDAPGQAAAAPHQGALCRGAAALPGVPVQHHRRRNRHLRQPDPGRHDLQHGKPAQAAGRPDRLKEVLAEVPRVRADAGYPPLVTPSSQIVGTQAVFNVMMGRYKVLTGEFADLMLGYYGKHAGRARPRSAGAGRSTGKKPPITERPADLLKPEWQPCAATAAGAARL